VWPGDGPEIGAALTSDRQRSIADAVGNVAKAALDKAKKA
jgi:hypothetical protein